MQPIYSDSYKYYSFEFFLDNQMPPRELITCVFCLLQDENGKVWLTKNKRGWEMPGGHIEDEDLDYDAALKREIMEEIGVDADDFKLVGYKKLTNFEKTPSRKGRHYPFPHSYIVYFTGKATSDRVSPFPSGEDETEDSRLCTLEEAFEIMRSGSNEAIMKGILGL